MLGVSRKAFWREWEKGCEDRLRKLVTQADWVGAVVRAAIVMDLLGRTRQLV